MKKDVVVSVQISKELKEEVETILAPIGLSASDLLRIFLIRTAQDKKPPFDLNPSPQI